jgi:hypothetical protein
MLLEIRVFHDLAATRLMCALALPLSLSNSTIWQELICTLAFGQHC